MTPQEKAAQFLAESDQFQLGQLPTESRHPKTTRLSELARTDLEKALDLLAELDRDAVKAVIKELPRIEKMAEVIRETLASHGRIFLCGCGATGRLSICIETLWREECQERTRPDWFNSVFSFIAGGDFALVRSIENFEDHPDYGARQLQDLGFRAGDLLISCTEGGETPFVIGATEEAARAGTVAPYFLFCNPPELLSAHVERSRRVIENPRIEKICLETGPMAVSGSTRMQATTVLQLAVGAALFSAFDENGAAASRIHAFAEVLAKTSFRELAPLIEKEADIYSRGHYCQHQTAEYGITVLTDTTERSPTFSLFPFESPMDRRVEPSWTYLCIPDVQNAAEAWLRVLGRFPRPLEWPEMRELFGMRKTLSYDFSPVGLERRRKAIGDKDVHVFDIRRQETAIEFSLEGIKVLLPRPEDRLLEHLVLKCALNSSSTLVMGRLGRIQGNLMVYVRPTNKKLIDRAIRFIRLLLEEKGVQAPYDEACRELMMVFERLPADEPVVLKTVESLTEKKKIPLPPDARSTGK